MNEAKGVCKERSRWRSVVSAYPHGKRREFMYVCMILTTIEVLFASSKPQQWPFVKNKAEKKLA